MTDQHLEFWPQRLEKHAWRSCMPSILMIERIWRKRIAIWPGPFILEHEYPENTFTGYHPPSLPHFHQRIDLNLSGFWTLPSKFLPFVLMVSHTSDRLLWGFSLKWEANRDKDIHRKIHCRLRVAQAGRGEGPAVEPGSQPTWVCWHVNGLLSSFWSSSFHVFFREKFLAVLTHLFFTWNLESCYQFPKRKSHWYFECEYAKYID